MDAIDVIDPADSKALSVVPGNLYSIEWIIESVKKRKLQVIIELNYFLFFNFNNIFA